MKSTLGLLIALGMLGQQSCGAEPTPDKIRAYLEQCDTIRPDLPKLLKAKIIPNEPADPPTSFPTAQEKRRAIEVAKKQLAEEKKTGLPAPPTLSVPPTAGVFSVGQVGVLDARAKVLTVIDAKQMLVELTFSNGYVIANSQTGATRDTSGHCTVLVRGVPTEGYADDQTTAFEQVLEVVGTHKYNTVAGSTRTVMALEPFDLEAVRNYRQSQSTAKPKK